MKVTIGKMNRYTCERPTEISFDKQDIWNLDNTLARIIAPALKRFKEVKVGTPCELTAAQWDTVLDKMIFTFEWYADESRQEAGKDPIAQLVEGLQLFAKYYAALWI